PHLQRRFARRESDVAPHEQRGQEGTDEQPTGAGRAHEARRAACRGELEHEPRGAEWVVELDQAAGTRTPSHLEGFELRTRKEEPQGALLEVLLDARGLESIQALAPLGGKIARQLLT